MYQYLYHYTTLGVLEKIFNDPNGKYVTLLMSEYHSLNDAEEGAYLYNFLRDYKDDIADSFETEDEKKYCRMAIDDFFKGENYKYLCEGYYGKHFSFSLSELGDSMQFWRQDYANENGIALRFNIENYEKGNKNTSVYIPIKEIRYLGDNTIKKVLLDDILLKFVETVRAEAEYVNHTDELDDDGSPSYPMTGAAILKEAPFWSVKNNVWESEKEYRMIKDIKSLTLSVKRRSNNKQELPYEIGPDFKPRYRMIIQNPFDEIILGPEIPDGYIGFVKDWLAQKHYDVDVTQSRGRERRRIKIYSNPTKG